MRRCAGEWYSGGERQPIPSGARLFRVAGLGWSVSPGILVANVPACRRQRIRPRNRSSLPDLSGGSYLLSRRKGRSRPRSRRPAGAAKSEALRTLAVNDSWFTDRLSHVGSKDAAMETSGVLIIEIAEMDALTKASSSAIKSFLTRRDDRFRPPYGKHMIDLPRQCVFAGSINPTAGGYLKDPTGARRFGRLRAVA